MALANAANFDFGPIASRQAPFFIELRSPTDEAPAHTHQNSTNRIQQSVPISQPTMVTVLGSLRQEAIAPGRASRKKRPKTHADAVHYRAYAAA